MKRASWDGDVLPYARHVRCVALTARSPDPQIFGCWRSYVVGSDVPGFEGPLLQRRNAHKKSRLPSAPCCVLGGVCGSIGVGVPTTSDTHTGGQRPRHRGVRCRDRILQCAETYLITTSQSHPFVIFITLYVPYIPALYHCPIRRGTRAATRAKGRDSSSVVMNQIPFPAMHTGYPPTVLSYPGNTAAGRCTIITKSTTRSPMCCPLGPSVVGRKMDARWGEIPRPSRSWPPTVRANASKSYEDCR